VTAELEAALAVLEVLATGDPGAADHVLTADAVLWHNDGTGEVPAALGFAGARAIHDLVDELQVDVLMAEPIPGGAVMRFEVKGTVKSTGGELCARNCLFATVVDGRITRVDEYTDPTFLTQLGL
jgi:ketosteroid isomerase-like protein